MMNEESGTNTKTASRPQEETAQKLRTFESDIASAMKTGQGSVLSVALAEQKKKEAIQEVAEEKRSNIYMIIFAVIFFIATSLLGAFFVYQKYGGVALRTTTEPTYIHPFLSFDTLSELEFSSIFPLSGSKEPLLYRAGSEETGLHTTRLVLITQKGDDGRKIESPTASVFARIGKHMPNGLERNLQKTIAIGVYGGDIPAPFIVLKTDAYENAFSGLLEWEKFMSDDLFTFMGVTLPRTEEEIQKDIAEEDFFTPLYIATTTASSSLSTVTGTSTSTGTSTNSKDQAATPPTKALAPLQTAATKKPDTTKEEARDISVFVDRTIKNKDMRVIQDNDGKIYFIYGFVDRSTIIMTTTVESFFEIEKRLKQ